MAGACAAQGVSSLPAALRDERLASARAPPARRGKEIRISSPDDMAMVEALVAQVTAWLQVRCDCLSGNPAQRLPGSRLASEACRNVCHGLAGSVKR